MDKGIKLSGILRGQVGLHVQIPNGPTNSGVIGRRVKAVDHTDPAAPGLNRFPGRLHAIADWRQHAHTCDDNSPFSHNLLHLILSE